MFLYVLLSLAIPFSAFANPLKDLSQKPKWHKLLHYKKSTFGNYKSEADGKKFFLHPEGKTSPLKEIQRSVELFSTETNPKDGHPICQFPLRYKWLNQELGMPWKANFSGCEKYISFFSKLAAKRALIVFSSYYLSNPNTAFGHTLLRLSRFDDSKETELLDYGINYSAEARATNPLTYAVKGLMGGYKGRFAAIPYYYKIREYSNAEFRDLWSYELNLTMVQVLEMVDHIWELGNTYFDYYYFHENCSYHLLSILDVVMPERNLTDNYHYFTIPADTIRLLKKEGLIGEGKRRDSTYTNLVEVSKGLKPEALETAKKIALDPGQLNTLLAGKSDQEQADILDVSLEAFDYFNADKILKEHQKTKDIKENILERRAKNPIISKDVKSSQKLNDSPALSHAPIRLGLYTGYEDNFGIRNRYEFRTSFHDLLDPPAGSLQEGQLEMGRLSVVHQQENYRGQKLNLDLFSIFSIKNFPEQNFWSSPLSWELEAGAKQVMGLNCISCPGGYFLGSVGNTLQFLDKRVLLSFLFHGDLVVQNSFEENFRLGLGPKIFTRVKFSDQFLISGSISYLLNTYKYRKVMEDQMLIPDFEARYHLNERFSIAGKANAFELNDSWQSRGELGLQYFY